MYHELKTWPEFFKAVWEGKKNFEVRNNEDRNFQIGDRLELQEYDPVTNSYTGRSMVFDVSYMTNFEQKPGFVVLALHAA